MNWRTDWPRRLKTNDQRTARRLARTECMYICLPDMCSTPFEQCDPVHLRRALQVIFGNIPYDEARRICNILSLAERRHELGKRFFQRIIKGESNVLFYLLPAKRDVQLKTRLRCARQYPTIYARTNRYKNSFILFGLNHFQWCNFVYFVYAWFSCMFV